MDKEKKTDLDVKPYTGVIKLMENVKIHKGVVIKSDDKEYTIEWEDGTTTTESREEKDKMVEINDDIAKLIRIK